MIQINKRWGIRTSGTNAVSLCKSIMVKGEKRWNDEYYFANIPQALNKLVDMAVMRGLDKGSWDAVISELEQTRAEISAVREALKG